MYSFDICTLARYFLHFLHIYYIKKIISEKDFFCLPVLGSLFLKKMSRYCHSPAMDNACVSVIVQKL